MAPVKATAGTAAEWVVTYWPEDGWPVSARVADEAAGLRWLAELAEGCVPARLFATAPGCP